MFQYLGLVAALFNKVSPTWPEFRILDTTFLEAGPASLLDIGGSLGKFIGGELASPVGLHSFLNLTVCTYGNAEREMNNIDGDQ